MPELRFTGERVVEGLVDSNLFNEHLSRYRFAARFVAGRIVLDLGCGSGYGVAEFSQAAEVIGIDQSFEAVAHARDHFGTPAVQFAQARCEVLPFGDASVDVVTAFEVIEHLQDWPRMLAEARRVLRNSGLFFVSTPNKSYYAESRAEAGPNPFHVHEFDFDEFQAVLLEVFPHVRIWSQNHAACIAFTCYGESSGEVAVAGNADPYAANYFLAVCSAETTSQAIPFSWVPDAGNALRERERHIQLLAREIAQKSDWLQELENRHAQLRDEHERVVQELRQSNRWAESVRAELEEARLVITDRDRELEGRDEWVQSLQTEIGEMKSNCERIQAELLTAHELNRAEIAELHQGYGTRFASLEQEMASVHAGYQAAIRNAERETADIHQGYQAVIGALEADLSQAREHVRECLQKIAAMNASRWVKIGRTVGVGPPIT